MTLVARMACVVALLTTWRPPSGEAAERFLLYRVDRIPAAAAPRLDGCLDDPAWQGRDTVDSLRNFLGPRQGDMASQATSARLVTDGVRLYIGVTLADEDMAAVVCNPARDPFWNDCIELYFDPRHDGTRSLQLVVDCGGQRMWEKRFDDGYGWWVDRAWHLLSRWEAAVARTPQAWSVEVAIDCASFGLDPGPGQACAFNVCRFRLGTEPHEFSAWGFGPNGRQKDMTAWGHLLFGAEGESFAGTPVSQEQVRRACPDLGDRVLEVPVGGGFMRYSATGVERVTFAGLLAPRVEAAQAHLAQAASHLAELPAALPAVARCRSELDECRALLAGALADAGEPNLGLGAYDRLADRLSAARDRGADLLWTVRLVELVQR